MITTHPSVMFADSIYKQAWEKLSKSGSNAAGIDGVSLEDIEGNTGVL